MAEARPPEEALRRPWHGASDRAGDPAVAAIRLQRAEVEAMLEYRRMPEGTPQQAEAWQRLASLRKQRRSLLPASERTGLLEMPPPPPPRTGSGLIARLVCRLLKNRPRSTT